MDSLRILPGTSEHGEKIKALYELVWPGERNPKEIDNHLALNHILIAEQDGAFAGFGMQGQFREIQTDDSDDYLLWFTSAVNAYHDGAAQGVLEAEVNKAAEFGWGNPFVTPFENDLPAPTQDDFYFCWPIVHPDFRRKGIAQALAEARIGLAKSKGAKVVFLEADQEGHSQALYEKLGFSKLALAGPWYHTGYATMLMGKVLD